MAVDQADRDKFFQSLGLKFRPSKSPSNPYFDERGQPLPMTEEQYRAWFDEGTRRLEEMKLITDETDADEIWDEILRNLGVDPRTGRGLEP